MGPGQNPDGSFSIFPLKLYQVHPGINNLISVKRKSKLKKFISSQKQNCWEKREDIFHHLSLLSLWTNEKEKRKLCNVWCQFPKNFSHIRHPIALLWGRDMGCCLLSFFLFQSLWCFMQHNVILDRNIMALDTNTYANIHICIYHHKPYHWIYCLFAIHFVNGRKCKFFIMLKHDTQINGFIIIICFWNPGTSHGYDKRILLGDSVGNSVKKVVGPQVLNLKS